MHRRNSTNPRRLDRRKSATSVKSVHLEHIPPETAERDAQVAATQAFARARARSATDSDSPLWPPPRCGGPSGSTSGCSLHSKTRSEETSFRRQQSIRFVQPRAPNMAANTKMAQAPPTSCISHTPKHVADIDVDPTPSSSGAAGDYINTLFTSDEYYTPEDDIASMPSSYRKLRKSRSMFTNRGNVAVNQLPMPAKSYSRPFRGDENIPPRGLKAPKSMSFLRDFRGNFVAGFKSDEDATRFTTIHNIRPKPSNVFSSKPSGPDRGFRKSMRDTSNDAVWMDGKASKDGSLRHKARRVLGKGDTNNTGLPLQHVDAQKSHIFGFGDLQHEPDDELLRVSSVDQAALSHVTSGIPSLHAVPSYQQLHSRQGSMESLGSDRKASDDRSRVTSCCREEREKKRLSIINEHGAHVCSSSANSASLNQPVQAAPGARMDQSQQAHTNSLERKIPRRKSSLSLRRLGRDAATTIRYSNDKLHAKDKYIPPSAYSSKPSRPTPIIMKRKEESQVYPESTTIFTNPEDVLSKEMDSETSKEAPPLLQTLSSRSSAFFGSPTRHLFRTQSPYRRALNERMNTATNEQPIKPPDFNPWIRSLSNLPNLQLQRSSTYGSDADIKLQYTESIYSTNTEDGQTRRESLLSVIEDFPRPRSTHGDATIFVDQPAYTKRSTSLPPKQRVSSSSSSVEWKMWLSSNVSKLEETSKQMDANGFQYDARSTRSSGHVRENAQINDEEEDKLPDLPDTPSRVRTNTNSFLNANYDDEDEDDDDDDQPTPFDAGDTRPAFGRSQPTSMNPLPSSISASSMVSSLKPTEAGSRNTSMEMLDTDFEKELPRVPSISFKENRTNRIASIPTKLAKRLPKPSMTPLTSRGASDAGEAQSAKLNGSANSRPKLYSMASTKSENVSPTAVSDGDPYGIEGSGVLGPNQQNVGSTRMVDIFLSSRRRRMTSEDEGSVFL
ncbi:hypothetical protein F4803DRAFT_568906 [Xylaria telfairii]|nr:hypothetical protein F4803DRAFT_568906 [Xylaria telfairii]